MSRGSGKRGKRLSASAGAEQFDQVGKQRAALQSAGDRGREGSLDKALTICRAGAVGELSVDDRAAERALRGVIGGLYTLDGDEGPKSGPDLQQVAGKAAVVAGAPALARGILAEPPSSASIGAISRSGKSEAAEGQLFCRPSASHDLG